MNKALPRALIVCASFLISKQSVSQRAFQSSYQHLKTSKLHPANQAVVKFFEAFSSVDTVSLKKYTTTDFMLLENGEVWNLQMVTNYIGNLDTTGYRRINHFDFINTEINENMAWTAYYNAADLTIQGKNTSYFWLESAYLIRVGNVWKIKLLHSTNSAPRKRLPDTSNN